MRGGGQRADVEERVRWKDEDVEGALEIEAPHLACEPGRVAAASRTERRAVVRVQSARDIVSEEAQGVIAQALIRKPAHIEPGVRLQGAQVLVEEMVHGKHAQPGHQRTRRAGSAKAVSVLRSSALIAKRATPAT